MTETATPTPVTITGEPDHEVGDFLFYAHADADDTDDFVCTATKPKMYVLLKVAGALGDENPVRQALALDQFLDQIVNEETAVHLRTRWEDPEDKMDVLWLSAFVQQAVGRWFGDPTGAVSGSRSSTKRTSGSSTVKRRSRASTS